MGQERFRVLVAKVGLDGHDRGAKTVAAGLRDAGCEVIYLGIRHTPAEVVRVAVEEDVDCVGLSCLSGAHMTLFREVFDGLQAAGASDIALVGGGIIPARDRRAMLNWGMSAVFSPGTPLPTIADTVRETCRRRRNTDAAPA